MAKTQPGVRVTVQFDPRMALEAIILNRLERIPRTRRQEWLRSLLVQGFRLECQALRGAPEDNGRRSAMCFTPGRVGVSYRPASPRAEPPAPSTRSTEVKDCDKPFAALGKVIG